MGQTTTNADAVLKDYYLEPIREQLNQKAVLMFAATDGGDEPNDSADGITSWKGIPREVEGVEFAGRQWVLPAHTSRNEGVGAIAEGGTIPVAGQQGWTDLKDDLAHNIGVIKLTRYAIRLSNRKPGVFVNLMKRESKGLVQDIRKDVNRQGFNDQTGTLATVTADGANTVTVDTIQYLRTGMFIDLVDSTNDTVLATNRQITAINESTLVVTYSGADATATTNHRLCRTGSWKKEINGLRNLIGATGTLHGVNSATNLWWQSVVKSSSGVLSEDVVQQVFDSIGAQGNGETELLISTRGIRRRYVNTLKSMKQFNDKDSVILRGGFKAVMINEMPLTFEDDCPRGYVFFLNSDALMWTYLNGGEDAKEGWDWVDDDGSILSRSTDRSDSFEGYLAADHDLAVTARNQLGFMSGLADDTAASWR